MQAVSSTVRGEGDDERSVSFPQLEDGEYTAVATATGRGTYTGTVRAHRMEGPGRLETEEGVFSGTFVNDELEGEGRYQCHESLATISSSTPNATEPGTASNDALTRGLALSDVREYIGPFHLTKFEGPQGTAHYKNGDVYSGPFRAGLPHGAEGRFTYADGAAYVGAVAAGRPHGHGRLTLANDDYYDGDFVHGARTGQGTAGYSHSARVFTGLWQDGRKVKGRLTFPGSERMYDGAWRDERPHGSGVMVFANGDRYEGTFDGGMLQGVGLLAYAGGPGRRYYYGQFLEDQPYGRGQLLSFPEEVTGAGAVALGKETVVSGYFLKGQLVPPGDTAMVAQVVEATKALPQPADTPPLPTMRSGSSSSAVPEAVTGRQVEPSAAPSPSDPSPAATATPVKGQNMPASHGGASRQALDDVAIDSDLSNTDSEMETEEERLPNDSIVASFTPAVSNSSAMADDSCKGWLDKCSIGRSTLGLISNWKRRFFILASFQGNVCLGYYDDELCRKPIGFLRLPPEDTRIVTRPSPRTHKKATKPGRELCIIYHEHRKTFKLLLRAADAADHARWVSAFLRYFTIVDRPTDFPLPAS